MAHAGPRYPLHFRRDMSANVTTRFGFAADYSLPMIDVHGNPLISPVQPNPWTTDGGVVTLPYNFTYTGLPFSTGVGVFDWQIILSGQSFIAINQNLAVQIRLNGVAFWKATISTVFVTDYKNLGGFGWQLVLNHPPAGIQPVSAFNIAAAVPW